jgi:hypothetical protein
MGVNAPAQNSREFVAVTTSDSVNLPGAPIGFYVGGAGDVALVGHDGAAVTFSAVPAGTILPCGAKRVNATNTTATLIVALY